MFYLKETTKKKSFEKEIDKDSFLAGRFLQSFAWSYFNTKNHNRSLKLLIYQKNPNLRKKIIGKAHILLINFQNHYYAYCPYGPILNHKLNSWEISSIFELIKKHLKKYQAIFLRFNPPILEKEALNFLNPLKLSKAKTKQPEKTLYLDLKKNEETLLKEMKAKTRYNIRLSLKKNLIIKKGISKQMITEFLNLIKITSQRDQFKSFSNTYYLNLIESLKKFNLIKIYTAYYNNQAIASNLMIFYANTATYLHGSSCNQNRNLMSTYALQWEAIKDAQKKKLKYYDFWGISAQKWPGVTQFKLGFGGTIVKFHPTYEIPLNKSKYFLYQILRLFL